MELIPIVIIVLGIISSIISGSKQNKDEGKRNIDPSKLEKRQKTAPRRRQFEQETKQPKGFFEELQEALETELNPEKFDKEQTEKKDTSSQKNKEVEKRKPRETIQRSSSKNRSSKDRVETDRSLVKKRAERAKERVAIKAYDKRVVAAEGLGRDIAEKARYTLDDSPKKYKKDVVKENEISSKDLTFDSKAVVNGIIMAEILGKPKSRR